MRTDAFGGITSAWARKDSHGAAEWVANLPAGLERDRSAESLARTIAEDHPHAAWKWALSINDINSRTRTAADVAQMIAARHPATARQWIQAGPFTPDVKAQIESRLQQRSATR
jgi:hypothetical protein